jgi:threonine dehydrogenase-like Zn-dependent dehydrogenase
VYVGLVQAEIPLPDPEFHRKEISLLASRNSTAEDFERVLRTLESGTIDVRTWVTHRVGFADLIGAFPDWLRPESRVIKAMACLD